MINVGKINMVGIIQDRVFNISTVEYSVNKEDMGTHIRPNVGSIGGRLSSITIQIRINNNKDYLFFRRWYDRMFDTQTGALLIKKII